MLARTAISMSVAVLSLVNGGCFTGRVSLIGAGDDRVVVDGEVVLTSGNRSLLELLRAKVNASRLGENASPEDQPLVIVDGIVMTDGPRSLAEIPASHAQAVVTMRGIEAVPVHGSKAEGGAIIVQTRRGRQ
jgi:hypothetical protein